MAGHSLKGAVVEGVVGGVHVEAPTDVLNSGMAIAAIATTATAEAAARNARGRIFICLRLRLRFAKSAGWGPGNEDFNVNLKHG
jgi:hypothetical protein